MASPSKRWLLGTHQGAVGEARLERYRDEFTFRFNRRHAKDEGFLFLLLLAVRRDPITHGGLVLNPAQDKLRAHHPRVVSARPA